MTEDLTIPDVLYDYPVEIRVTDTALVGSDGPMHDVILERLYLRVAQQAFNLGQRYKGYDDLLLGIGQVHVMRTGDFETAYKVQVTVMGKRHA